MHTQPGLILVMLAPTCTNSRLSLSDGAESAAMASDGSLVLATREGGIWRASQKPGGSFQLDAKPFAKATGGRPLGLHYDKNGNLIICNAGKVGSSSLTVIGRKQARLPVSFQAALASQLWPCTASILACFQPYMQGSLGILPSPYLTREGSCRHVIPPDAHAQSNLRILIPAHLLGHLRILISIPCPTQGLEQVAKGSTSVTPLATRTSKDGVIPATPILYANDLDIAPDGTIYFTDSGHFTPQFSTAKGFHDTMSACVLMIAQVSGPSKKASVMTAGM